jgi:DNA-binding CsgD family transcriptional regulator
LVRDYWRSALAIGALGFCAGVMHSLAVGDHFTGSLNNIISMASSLFLAVSIILIWQKRQIKFNITAAYRLAFPFLITVFFLFPYLLKPFVGEFSGILYAIYSCATMLMMIQCAQAARDRGINPIVIYGLFGGVVYSLHYLGLVLASYLKIVTEMNFSPLGTVALFCVFLLSLLYFVINGGFKHVLPRRSIAAENIELIRLSPLNPIHAKSPAEAINPEPEFKENTVPEAKAEHRDNVLKAEVTVEAESHEYSPKVEATESANDYQYIDLISMQAQRVKDNYQLTTREAEVMELLARGKGVTRIAEELVVSENTIRTHSKRIYLKLDIHKKQELMDLLEEF